MNTTPTYDGEAIRKRIRAASVSKLVEIINTDSRLELAELGTRIPELASRFVQLIAICDRIEMEIDELAVALGDVERETPRISLALPAPGEEASS